MILLALLLFAMAALLGLYLLSYVWQNKNTPKGVAFTHGPLAATGLILLIIYALLYQPAPLISILIFILAAAIGVILIYRDLMGKLLPKWLAITHGLVAIIGFICLLVFIYYY